MKKYLLYAFLSVLLIIFCFYMCKSIKENFVVPKNSDKIDQTEYRTIYSNEVKYYIDILKDKYKNKTNDMNYIKFDKTLDTILTKRLRNYIIDELRNNVFQKVSNFSKYYLDITIPFTNIQYKYIENQQIQTRQNKKLNEDLLLKFNTIISFNNVHEYGKVLDFLARDMEVIIKISARDDLFNLREKDILNIYKEEYFYNIKFEIVYAGIKDIDKPKNYPFKPIDELYENNYNITNKLYLLTPFTSSYDEMIITEKMRQDYEKNVPNLKDIQAPIYRPFI